MDLEQRVQILEQELQILKGQIQATLLEMQEYLLTNAHPILRAEEVSHQEKSVLESPQVVPNHIRAGLEVFEDDEEEVQPSSPIVKRVKLEDVKSPAKSEPSVESRNGTAKMSARIEEADDDEEQDDLPAPRRAPSNDRQPKSRNGSTKPSAYIEDEEEDNDTDLSAPPVVRRVTLSDPQIDERATRPSRRSMNQSRYAEPDSEVDEEEEPQVPEVSNGRRRNSAPPVRPTIPTYEPVVAEPIFPDVPPIASASSQEWTALNRLAEWVGEKVKNLGPQNTRELIERNAQKGRFTDEVKDALLQLVALYDDDGSLNSQRLDNVVSALSEPASSGPYEEVSEDDPQDANQRLILRLIAGVQTVGTSTVRRKKNG